MQSRKGVGGAPRLIFFSCLLLPLQVRGKCIMLAMRDLIKTSLFCVLLGLFLGNLSAWWEGQLHIGYRTRARATYSAGWCAITFPHALYIYENQITVQGNEASTTIYFPLIGEHRCLK